MARAAAKRGGGKKQAARPGSKSQQVAAAKATPRRQQAWENELFFGRMRRHMRWVFAFLAIVFAGSFVFLGVGSGGSALTDFLNGNIHLFGSGGGPSEKSLENKVAKDPSNAKVRLQLAELYSKNNHNDKSIAEYDAYLKLKPNDTNAMNELGNVYGSKVKDLQTAVQSPPTPPLAAINAISPISSSTTLGTAISTLTPTEFGAQALQLGEAAQLQKILVKTVLKHVGVYLDIAKKSPGDSSQFLTAANTAGSDGDLTLQLKLFKQFLVKYPSDPLVPDVKKNITKIEKQIKSGATSSTTSGTTTGTG